MLFRSTIRIGQKLAVYVDPGKAERYSKVNTMSFAEKQRLEGKSVSPAPVAAAVPAAADGDYEVYTVRNGDTVWDIAKKYSGVSATDIMSLNNLSDASRIKVGQKLRIRKKS